MASHEPLKGGYDVDENAVRFSNYFHVLRELVHLSCGWLPLEPRLEVKYVLGDHLHDDARGDEDQAPPLRAAHAVDYPGAPAEELAALLDRANAATTGEYVEIAYGELKPALIAALGVHLEHLDPVLDEPSLRQLTQLLHRQERHVAELPAAARGSRSTTSARCRSACARCASSRSCRRSTSPPATATSRSPRRATRS